MRLYPITIDIENLTPDMIVWATAQGADIFYQHSPEVRTVIRFPDSKPSAPVGRKGMRLHFNNTQRGQALLFLLSFPNHVIKHNIEEINNGVENLYATT
jgi:hypothetical protein